MKNEEKKGKRLSCTSPHWNAVSQSSWQLLDIIFAANPVDIAKNACCP